MSIDSIIEKENISKESDDDSSGGSEDSSFSTDSGAQTDNCVVANAKNHEKDATTEECDNNKLDMSKKSTINVSEHTDACSDGSKVGIEDAEEDKEFDMEALGQSRQRIASKLNEFKEKVPE